MNAQVAKNKHRDYYLDNSIDACDHCSKQWCLAESVSRLHQSHLFREEPFCLLHEETNDLKRYRRKWKWDTLPIAVLLVTTETRDSKKEAYLRAVCQTCIMHGIVALEIWAHQIDLLVCSHRPQQHHHREISLVGSLVDVDVMIVQCGRCVYNTWICRPLLSNWLFWACCECTCLTDLACLAWPHHTSAFMRIYRCCISCGYSTLQGCCRSMMLNGMWLP